ncbi:hypothetical protein [Candidatus Solincola tengchongensis]|uniref:hypothetical protein n=1 Tax=Candidatus Solincola tengchongensis TaxID=2900693 RepID=UPI00257B61B1|nr:hypothetical protein [Candidatus Solincola tengchongensis]
MGERVPAGSGERNPASERGGGETRHGRARDPRLEALISDWKRGEKDRWRGHGKSTGRRKR